ncbi:MAG: UDP-N-acetylmuramoyl-L-alanine--D-glutamate ligase, partial [Oscillospiraceae bacterium]
MTLDNYFTSLKGKSIAVVGYGISNAPLTELLLNRGCDVTIRDKRTEDELSTEAPMLREKGAKLHLGADYLSSL